MGVIRGSELTLDTQTGYLDQKTYESLPYRTQSSFARQKADRIYALFEAYLRRKRELNTDDLADRYAGSVSNSFV